MADSYGRNLHLTIYGGSHDEKIGMTLEGMPKGFQIDMELLQSFLARRAPGQSKLATSRKESDKPVFLRGVDENFTTTGEVIEAVIYNTNQHSKDYESLKYIPRPAHADYSAVQKYGIGVDLRGGGHFSGRLTAPLCIAGGICLQYLKKEHNIEIAAHIFSIGKVEDTPFDSAQITKEQLQKIKHNSLPVLDAQKGELMQEEILAVKAQGDSIGGVVECAALNVPSGLGEHMFNGAENRISSIIFAIPAVKAIEFGNGFGCAALTGSVNNDSFYTDGKKVYTKTNNCGGILGGITNGMPLVFRAAVKPTPSIYKEQDSVDLRTMENVKLTINGRHDPCIVPRAVPVFEGALAIALMDMLLDEKEKNKHLGNDPELYEQIAQAEKNTPAEFPATATVACQGVQGAYSQLAAEKLFLEPQIRHYQSFEDVFKAVAKGECRYGVLPIENSTAGSVTKVYDLMRKYQFFIVCAVKLRVEHNLLSKKGVELKDIKEVLSHEQALQQCHDFLQSLGEIKITECANTALAAQMVAEGNRRDIAALSSKICARNYNLAILKESVQDKENNFTRFICISKEMEIYPGADKMSIMLSLRHKPGELYRILAQFAALDINLTKLESRPLGNGDFEFMFYFDFALDSQPDQLARVLTDLKEQNEYFSYLGSYKEIR